MRRICIAAAFAASVVAAPAGAATIVGTTATSAVGGCGSDFMAWNTSAESTVPPGGGIITSMATTSPETSGHVTLKIVRPSGGSVVVVVASTAEFAVHAGVNRVATHFPVSGGEQVGMYSSDSADCRVASGAVLVKFPAGGDPGPGTTVTPNDSAPLSVAVEARLEADADHDGFADESEDTCPADPAIHDGACVVDLSAAQTVTPTTIGVGDVAVGTVTVANGSGGTGFAVSLGAATTPGLQVVAMVPGSGCSFSPNLTCSLGTLSGGASTVAAVVVRGVTAGGQSLTSTVASQGTDPNAANNAASTPITVERRVALRCAVPSLKGLTRAVAKRLLTATNCKLGKVTKKQSKKGRKGTVVKQAKKAGSRLPAGSKINVTLKK